MDRERRQTLGFLRPARRTRLPLLQRPQRASLGRPLCIHTLAALPGLPPLTRSGLIAELAASNPHLRQADVELIVTAIFDQISATLWHAAIAWSCVASAPSW